jgi:hypothetical protein
VGGAVVAREGLFVVEADGRVSAHPAPIAVGVALASHGDAAFGIFEHEGRRELRRITRSTNDLVRSLDEPFRVLAAGERELWLLSWVEKTLVLQSIFLSGELGKRVTWTAPSVVASAELRELAGRLYVSIWGSAAPWATLGQVTEQGYEPLVEARSGIAGPIGLPSGTYVALDGAYERLVQGAMGATPSSYMTCLGSQLGLAYGCAGGALWRVDENGLGAPLFELTSLREPSYAGLDEVQRADCKVRWLDLRDHIAEVSRASVAADASVTDATVQNVGAPDAAADAASSADASGCALGGAAARGAWPSWSLLFLLVTARGVRPRRPLHARSDS